MHNNNPNKKDNKQQIYLTQKELAQRWRVSESTIKKWREDGQIPFFRPPGSIRPLYPIEEIIIIESDRLNSKNKERCNRITKHKSNINKKPVAPNTKWEV